MSVQIIVPAISEDELSSGLRRLTREIEARDPDLAVRGCLGGSDGYGCDFENEVFEMHPQWWGDCTCGYDKKEEEWCNSHEHADDCYQTKLKQRERAAGVRYWNGETWGSDLSPAPSYDEEKAAQDRIYSELCAEYGLNREFGAAVHCTCDYKAKWAAWVAENNHDPRCPTVLPNFRHKRTGFEVEWYKYIGRSMETKGSCNWLEVLTECINSLGTKHRGSRRKG